MSPIAVHNPFEQMKLKQDSFTATDWQVHDVLNANLDAVLRGSATSLAEEFHISQPAITRYCKKLGYNGFSEFKMAVYQYNKSAGVEETPETTIEYYNQLLRRIPPAMDEADIPTLVDRIARARSIFSTGYHKSSLPAQLLNFNLMKFGLVSHFWPYDYFSSAEQFATKDDVLIIFSATSKTYQNTLDMIRENPESRRPYIVLVTMNAKNPLRNKVDQMIWLPNYQNQNYSQYLETQITFMIFVDLLTNALAQHISV